MWLQLLLTNIRNASADQSRQFQATRVPEGDSLNSCYSSSGDGGPLAPLCGHVLQAVRVETIEIQPGREKRGGAKSLKRSQLSGAGSPQGQVPALTCR